MLPEPSPLHVVLVSHDVALLHEIAWLLEAVAYKVHTTTDTADDALWRRYAEADFVIVDGRTIGMPTAATFSADSDNPVYRIFLYDPTQNTDFSAWFAAGAHDGLRTPISRGEILARMRTGARYIEFERRLQQQALRAVVPGMYSRRGFLRKLAVSTTDEENMASQHTLLVTAIDWFSGIRRKHGESACRNLVKSAARVVRRTAGEEAVCAYLGNGEFGVLLAGHSMAAVKRIAESLANDFVNRDSHHESAPRSTLTSAAVPFRGHSNSAQWLAEALEALRLAQHSGGHCVVMHGDFGGELTAWQEEMSAGNPFATVAALDIMEPFPALIEDETEQREMLEVLRRSAVPVRPHVDRQGRLIGVAEEKDTDNSRLVMPETISSDASFPEIYEAFSTRGCTTLVVTAEDRPLGYLTCNGFLSMIDPVYANSFVPDQKQIDSLEYLVVPSQREEDIAAPQPGQ